MPSDNPTRIFLVDDDAELCSLLGEFLKREGFTVEFEHEGNRGLQRAQQDGVDLVVLDVMLPGIDGFEILRRLREQSRVPGDHADRARRRCGPHRGTGTGRRRLPAEAFQPARTGGPHPRHSAALRTPSRRVLGRRLEVNGISLDPGTREVLPAASRVELTTFEFDILEMLMRSAGRVLSRDALMENFYNRKATPFDRSIDMHISHLRKKLEAATTSSRPSAAWATSSAARRRTLPPPNE